MPTAPYPLLQDVLNVARVRLNDAIVTPSTAPAGQVGGEVFSDIAIFSQVTTNAAWQKFQEEIADLGFSKFQKEVILTGLEPKVSNDPSVQVSLDWAGYSNGTTFDPTIALPQDMILPMFLWERQTGMNNVFSEMVQWLDGMPSIPQVGYNRIWEWRGDAIYMPGGNVTLDLRVRYAAYLSDFVTDGGTEWYNQPVPIMRSQDALAWYIAAEFGAARGDIDATLLEGKASAATAKIYNRDSRQKQRVNIRRMSQSGRLEGNGYGYGGFNNGW